MPDSNAFSIAPVRTQDELAAVTALFRDYAASLNVDMSYQDFDAELAAMPGNMRRRKVNCCWRALRPVIRLVVSVYGGSSLTAAAR